MSSAPNPAPQAPATDASAAPATPQITPIIKPKGLTPTDLTIKVSDIVSTTGGDRVLNQFLKVLVDKEIDKRAVALQGGYELAVQTASALKKAMEPDIRPTMFDLKGKPVGESGWSKAQLKAQKTLTEKLAKIDKAIDAATRDRVPEVADQPAVGVEGGDGYAPAIKGKPAIEPDFSLLYNLKAEIEKAEKQAAETSAE